MPLSLNDPEAEYLAQLLAERTGESVDEVVVTALRQRLKEILKGETGSVSARLLEIGRECSAMPDIDRRSPEEILGYDDRGIVR
ncbi:MAG: type II toxin-antitoxin system VapB family antitoxin [Bryobacterales bacterium]|nr:type II toxin-antitoxin system VapB family antitoxin [Bryobacterales bacterium]